MVGEFVCMYACACTGVSLWYCVNDMCTGCKRQFVSESE